MFFDDGKDYDQLLLQVLPVEKDKNVKFSQSSLPSSGQEYLRRVVSEAKKCPEVKVSDLKKLPIKTQQNFVIKPEKLTDETPAQFKPSLKWQNQQLFAFSTLKIKLQAHIENIKTQYKLPYKLPPRDNKEGWLIFLYGQNKLKPLKTNNKLLKNQNKNDDNKKTYDNNDNGDNKKNYNDNNNGDDKKNYDNNNNDVDNKTSYDANNKRDDDINEDSNDIDNLEEEEEEEHEDNEEEKEKPIVDDKYLFDSSHLPPEGLNPLISILTYFDQKLICDLIQNHISWLTKYQFTHKIGLWLYCISLCVEKPLPPDLCSSVRRLIKLLLNQRAEFTKSSTFSFSSSTSSSILSPCQQLLGSFNLTICILSRYFQQTDLSD